MSSRLVASSILAITCAACGAKSPPKSAPPAPTPVVAPATPPAASAPAPASELAARRKQLADLLDEQWQYTLRTSPEFASILGDHRYDDRWSDGSLEAIAKDLAADKDFLARFEAIDTTGFPEQEALDKTLMVRELRETVEDARFEDWLMPVNQIGGPHLGLPRLVSMLRFETVDDYEHYLTRLKGVPVVFDQTIAAMKAGVAKHLVPPKILLSKVVEQSRGLAKTKPADSPFAQPLAKFPASIAKADQDRLRAAILDAITKDVDPAYRDFATYVEKEYVPAGRAEPGLWSLPDGDARYAARAQRSTTTDLTPDQIHQIGLDEVKRIEVEELAVARQLGFKDLDALRKHVRGDKKLYAKSRAQILDAYRAYVDQMYTKLPALFGHLPKQRMQVQATEPFREKTASAAEYEQGTPDGSRPGMVRVNTSDPTHRLMIDAETTAYHEGVPGHHLQIAIQQELGDLPPFRQQGNYTAYAEGWALYAESLGGEVGFYQDPWSLYGHLDDEMLRAIRLVVDTGLHAKHWTRQQVVDFFHAHSSVDEVNVQSETDRYISWPGQALGYKIGQLTILRLRTEAEAALGKKFDLKAFHDEVLGAGALPMDVLEARIHAWIERVKRS